MSASNAGDPGLIPGSGRSPGEGNGNRLQYSCLENPMDREAWWATVHGVAKSRTRRSDFTSFLPSLQSHLTSGIYWRLQLCTLRLMFLFSCFSFYFVEIFNQILYFSYRTHPKYITLYLTCAVLSHFSCVRLFVIPWTVCSLPGSSVHGVLQARILEWVAMPSLYLT